MDRNAGGEYYDESEDYKIFDLHASVRLMERDIARFDYVLPETLRQVYNEELTYVAESINAPLITRFKLRATPEGLVDERGRLLQEALTKGRLAAEAAASRDHRLEFNVTRVVHDYEEGRLLESMMRGEISANTVVSVKPFSEEAYRTHGKDCVESIGMQPDRLLAFISIYNKVSDDELEVISLSVDNSDLEAFTVLMKSLGVSIPPQTSSDDFLSYRAQLELDRDAQLNLPEQLTNTYDRVMQTLYDQEFQAGRLKKDEVEAWGFISSQKDLVLHYFTKLEILARTDSKNELAKKELTYGFWAALNTRMKTNRTAVSEYDDPVVRGQILDREMNMAFAAAAARHEQMVGCGGRVGMEPDILDESPENAAASIFGDKKEGWAWKKGICQVPKCPSPKPTEVGPCKVCRNCQKKSDSGADLMSVYKLRRTQDNKKPKWLAKV